MQICLPSNSKEEILVCYFRMAKSLNSSLVIVLSFLNSHLSILDFGLPVSFNHLFLENKHETSKHSLITTTTKNIILLTKLPNWNTEQKFWNLASQKDKHSKFIIIIIIKIILIITIASLINIRTILADPDPGLSLRGRGWGFFPATKNVPPNYFQRKSIAEKQNQKKPLAVWFPVYFLYFPGNLKS